MKSNIQKINNNKMSKMSKKVILILAIVLSPLVSSAQSIFDKFEDMDNVGSIILNQRMFSLLASMDLNIEDEEGQELYNEAKKITGVKAFTTDDSKVTADMLATVNKYLKTSKLDELMRMKDGNQSAKFYVKEGKDEYNLEEFLMIVTGLKEMTGDKNLTINGKNRQIETVLVTITGDFNLKKVAKILNKMNVPGSDKIEKASEKN